MTTVVLLLVIIVLLAINIGLWKFGFVDKADKPELVSDSPPIGAKERRAIMKRLKRWREAGLLSLKEYDHITALCDREW